MMMLNKKLSSFLVFLSVSAAVVASSSFAFAENSENNEHGLMTPEDYEDEEMLMPAEEGEGWRRSLVEYSRGLWGWGWGPPPAAQKDVVDTAIEYGLSVLVDLVQSVEGLEDTLRGAGPFTLFAPTDDAFDAVPSATMMSIAENSTGLADVLGYHVLSGEDLRTIGNDWRGGGPFDTVSGGKVRTKRYRAGRRGPLVKQVNGATVLVSDISASNGVVQIIDAVLLP